MINKKKRVFSRYLAAITLIIAGGLVFTGCSGDEASVPNVPVTRIELTSSITGEKSITLAEGQSEALRVLILPDNATNNNVRWESSNTSVAIASESVVYAIGAGTATITATAKGNTSQADTVTVTVTPVIAVTGVALDLSSFFLVVGDQKTLTPTLSPSNATNDGVSWASYNIGVAMVQQNGTVIGTGPGTTTIVVTTNDGKREAECVVTVAAVAPPIDGMVWIYPGTFMMGSPLDEPESLDAEIPHQVTLTKGFYMGEHPVTQAEFKAVMGYDSSFFPSYSRNLYADRKDEFPTERLMWYEAIMYCNFLSEDMGLQPVYAMYKKDALFANYPYDYWIKDNPDNWSTDVEDWGRLEDATVHRWDYIRVLEGNGYRLPTEAQWEYACRAETTTAFHTGNSMYGPVMDEGLVVGGNANFYGPVAYDNGYVSIDNGIALFQTIPGGEFPPNKWGLYDMHGNVAEWCFDWYGSYRGATTNIDPTGPEFGSFRILRGGSYYDFAMDIRSASRYAMRAYSYDSDVGFRIVVPYSEELITAADYRKARPRTTGIARNKIEKMAHKAEFLPRTTQNFERPDRTSVSPVRLEATLRESDIKE
jgi:formylglycine-generating enzyme required for sulfatase activity